jgi:hypothetical protein
MEKESPGALVLDKVKNTRISVSVTLLVTILVGTYLGMVEGNRVYVSWHDQHVTAVAVPLIAAQTNLLSQQITETQSTATATALKLDEVSRQIDGLQISAAINTVSAFQAELDRHERKPQNSESWLTERDRLKRQLERATEYRNCLMAAGENCDELRAF